MVSIVIASIICLTVLLVVVGLGLFISDRGDSSFETFVKARRDVLQARASATVETAKLKLEEAKLKYDPLGGQ